MIDYEYSYLFLKDSVGKQMTIISDDGTITITNEELHFENFELKESLCSQSSLRFGCCEASAIKFKISNVFLSMVGKWLTVAETLEGAEDAPFTFGRYKVFSDVPTADKRYRNVTAYDSMYDIINADMSNWYNTLLQNNDSTVTLKEFRDSFFEHFGITQETVTLINDSMTVEKTIQPTKLSGKDVITAICEINGVFGHIGRDGKFQYVQLKEIINGLYPANDLYPKDDLYPRESNTENISKSKYKKIEYEDYICQKINKLQIRQEENDIGAVYPPGELQDTDNCYIVEDNFLVYGKGATELADIAQKLYSIIVQASYRPFTANVLSNPCIEVGDLVRFHTNLEIIEGYVLQRTIKGIQLLNDTMTAKGTQKYDKQVNGVTKSIQQLKGKTNVLERTVEETKSTITDVEKGLQSQITQNAESITAEVTRATSAEESLAASIKINADNILLKVSKGDISSEISQEAGKISIKSNRFSLESDNTKISEDGTLECKNIKITGGSINIETAYDTYDFITLKNVYDGKVNITSMSPFFFTANSNGAQTNYNGDGVYSYSITSYCKTNSGWFNEIYPFSAGGAINIYANTKINGSLSANSLTLGGSALSKKTVKSLSSDISTKSVSIPSGYILSGTATLTYNANLGGYIITGVPTLTSIQSISGYLFSSSVSVSDVNVIGY